ncbi:AMP-binding protein [Haloactinomyces albus]|uniref:Acyl-CoA synthetase (AMP-forming)/AMP-acid ligase II n=1 Tax=Haloactinomyces albus TaxID=1352928 RepID=A0AAE3ZFP9_9ACTN|nr:AMP-binding protein [Haloactinomyces albus]MDR7304037.1 acyl-CoA synthetase (AMP-forming)/AMP-acid ligase II [Haloactinomyces albus]
MDLEQYVADLRQRQAGVRPAGTPSEVVYPLGELTIPEHVAHWAAHCPQRAAIVFEGRTVTYAELDELIGRVAGWFASVGVGPGDRVAVHLPNAPQFIIAMMAVLRLGAVHVPVNPMFHGHELAHELGDSGAEVAVTTDTLLPLLESVRADSPVREVLVTGAAEMADPERAAPARIDAPEAHVTRWADAVAHPPGADRPGDLDALAALNYTGGTTGLPKGCEHTQRHMLYTAATSAAATRKSTETGYVALCYLPIFWIAGEDLGILNPLVLGGTSVLMPRWEPDQALASIDRYGVTTMVGTVENYLELLQRPDFSRYDLSSLTDPMAVSFVRKLSPDVRHRWAAAAGPESLLREGAYGMTETHTFDATPYGLAEDDADLRSEPVFCGIPVPGTDIAVVSFDTGEPLEIGEAGEIIVRSPSVMRGYWNKPEETAQQLRGGWLHTGDNGRIDADGCVHYLGRDKDMIKVNGMSVFPAELEVLLSQHPDVQVVAVVPADDTATGQQPVAFVGVDQDSTVDAAKLREWATENMAAYKVPLVEIMQDFPMTATGKIRKVDLAQRAQQLADRR